MPRAMGLDVGDRKIGVALSNPSETLASVKNNYSCY